MSDLRSSIENDAAALKASMSELEAVISEFAVAARLEWPGPFVALDAGDGNWIPVAELVLSREPRVMIQTPSGRYEAWIGALSKDSGCRAPLIHAVGWKNTREPGTPGWDGP